MSAPDAVDSRRWTGGAESQAGFTRTGRAPGLNSAGSIFLAQIVGFCGYAVVMHLAWRGLGSPAMMRGPAVGLPMSAAILAALSLWWWGRTRLGRIKAGFLAALAFFLAMTTTDVTELIGAVRSPGAVEVVPLMVAHADRTRFERGHSHLGARIHAVGRAGRRHAIAVRDAALAGLVAGDSCLAVPSIANGRSG